MKNTNFDVKRIPRFQSTEDIEDVEDVEEVEGVEEVGDLKFIKDRYLLLFITIITILCRKNY
jgi:hypothetical protein